MRMVLQRVKRVALTADGVFHDQMQQGILAMIGIQSGDEDEKVMKYMLDKLLQLRIFEDENGKMNQSVTDKKYSVFLVSNFTLYGDCRHGRRPGYSSGAPVEEAAAIYEQFVQYAKEHATVPVHTGVFQADMQIAAELDGPVTLLLDSNKEF